MDSFEIELKYKAYKDKQCIRSIYLSSNQRSHIKDKLSKYFMYKINTTALCVCVCGCVPDVVVFFPAVQTGGLVASDCPALLDNQQPFPCAAAVLPSALRLLLLLHQQHDHSDGRLSSHSDTQTHTKPQKCVCLCVLQ